MVDATDIANQGKRRSGANHGRWVQSGSEDSSPAAASTVGRGVYVINMRTGARLGFIATDYSVPADVSIVDSDGDGFVDRVYLVHVRAQLYRIDIEDAVGDQAARF